MGELLREQEKAGRIIGAICAAPTALHKHNICLGKQLTSYPAMKEKMLEGGKYEYKEDRVVVDGKLNEKLPTCHSTFVVYIMYQKYSHFVALQAT